MNDDRMNDNGKKARQPGLVRLSARLMAVAGFVKPGSRVADIGTDHGYIPIYLVQTGKAISALAMDVRIGPLERAREHIREYGLDAIDTRLSDGLERLRPGEADTVIIAGMGGELEMKILEEGRGLWEHVGHFILSPQSEPGRVRRFLDENGFSIEDEAMVKDEGKFYTVMSVVRGRMGHMSQAQYHYGKILMDRKDHTLKEYLDRERARVEIILRSLADQGKPPVPALVEELSRMKEAQDEMQ